MSFKRTIAIALIVGCMLMSGCGEKPVGVGVHAVNYTEDEISYRLVDPIDKENRAGGESINSYEAGGLMCCYSVPAKWRPGIKVELHAEVWLTSQPNEPNGRPKIVNQMVILDLPEPVDGKPSELWVIRNPDGRFDLVAANLGPTHPQWPGKIKGWPVASKSYRQKLIRRELAEFEDTLRLYQEEQQALENDASRFAKDQWEFDMEYRKDEVANFSGPSDQRYIEHLKKHASEMTSYAEEKISLIKRALQ